MLEESSDNESTSAVTENKIDTEFRKHEWQVAVEGYTMATTCIIILPIDCHHLKICCPHQYTLDCFDWEGHYEPGNTS